MKPIPRSPAEERELLLLEIHSLQTRLGALESMLAEEITAKASLFRTIDEHQGRYVDLVESTPWIVARVDDHCRYIDANSYFASSLGRSIEELLDQPVGSLSEGDEWSEAVSAFAASSQYRSEPCSVPVFVRGQERSFLLLMHRPKAGPSFTILALDQTERDQALARAEASAEDKAMFLAVMSHELRTPMNGVLGLAALLTDTPLNEEQADLVSTIEKTGTTLVRIINDVLDLSKAENGAVQFESVPFSVEQTVRAVVATLGAAARQSSARLEAELPDDLPELVLGDQHRLQQVLTNLAGNALKFTPGGLVRVQVDHGEEDGDRAVLNFRVIDNGVGIEDAELERLFEAFTQADSSVSRRYGGTGLGLTISKLLVEGMGGRISASSAPGEGSTFEFTLRLQRTNAAATSLALEAAPTTGTTAPMRVLVAEDNLVNQRVARGLLEKLGHDVAVVSNGLEAIRAVEQGEVDLILMDVNMPVLDGLEATRRIRSAAGPESGLPIVALTANAIEGDQQVCLEAGMDFYLSKPFSKKELERSIRAVTARRSAS
ncbi:ATP-binding protein [bacterium]|nr:ATP-binding protein [bacterium]